MAKTKATKLRALWLSIHKWIGLLLAVLIIPISLTGSALVWHDWVDEAVNPQRYAVKSSEPALGPAAYAAAARAALAPGERLASLRYPEDGHGPMVAGALRPAADGGRPTRISIWLDPADGRVLDTASANSGLVQVMHVLHGSLMVPGWGRTIVGWVGVFMFVSCLTGIWLWWPVSGSVRRGFRWRRQNSTNANLHHQMGFWILLPLAMLSFTGLWISFPGVFGGGAGGPPGARQGPAQPLAETQLAADAALAAALPLSQGARLVSITWPTDRAPEWKLGFERVGEIAVSDATALASPPDRAGGQQRPLMRRLHDGTGMGLVWQIIIFIGGIIPVLLAITGIVMWLRSRGWRAALEKKRKAKLVPQPAE